MSVVARFRGMPIHTSELVPDPPRLKLSRDVTVSPAFRLDMDRWLLERFGRNPDEPLVLQMDLSAALPLTHAPGSMAIVLHPRHWPLVRAQMLLAMNPTEARDFLNSELGA